MSPTSYQTAPPRIKLVVNRSVPINEARMIKTLRPFANLFLKRGAESMPARSDNKPAGSVGKVLMLDVNYFAVFKFHHHGIKA